MAISIRSVTSGAVLFASLIASGAAFPGTLVLRDGVTVETRGRWWQEARQIVFRMANGTLAALPLAEVDLEASRQTSGSGREPLDSRVLAGRLQSERLALLLKPDPEILELVQGWSGAWAAQDVAAYLSYYASSFVPADGLSRAGWQKLRRSRLESPEFIKIRITGLRTTHVGEKSATASFRQRYESNTYRDDVTKVLSLVRENEQWRIAREGSPGIVITDRDVGHSRPIGWMDQSGDEGGATPAVSSQEGILQVSNWRADLVDAIDGVRIVGTIRNQGDEIALRVALIVRLFSENGTPIGRAPGKVNTTALEPGNSLTFTADFPGVQNYSDIRFDLQSFDVVLRSGGASGD